MRRILFILIFTVNLISVSAEIRLASLFSDNMVLQQQCNAAIWGTSTANGRITITPSWSGRSVEVFCDDKGAWRAAIATPAAGGPYTIAEAGGIVMAP